ncbi:30S ribosomal protein S17 [bacterium]|nr:MAG: 30S ribosomal protein S17 [bacterium]
MDKTRRKTRTGVVVSDKMQKTIVVKVERSTRHPLYKKTIRRYKKFKAHDESSSAKTGDTVKIMETRPLSKEKRWRLLEVLKKA